VARVYEQRGLESNLDLRNRQRSILERDLDSGGK
jgi:hypothetical protein